MIERKKEATKGLVVKGVGYATPSSSIEKPAPVRKPIRGPFVMPSAPIKRVPRTSNRIAMTPTAQSRTNLGISNARFGSMSNLDGQKEELCNCQHPADIEFLQDVYVENMRIRLEMLELENKYLKGGSGGEEEPGANPRASRASTGKKRVEFADRRLFGGNESASLEKLTSKQSSQLPNEQELFDKLEEAYQKEFRLQEKIKALSVENKRLVAARDDAEKQLDTLNSGEKSKNRERHTLMQDNVELQRRLDDLTPLLAAKDAEIERLEMEKTSLISKIRRLSTGTASRQDRDATQELALKDETIERLEKQLRQQRQRDENSNEELEIVKRKLKEEQMSSKREQAARESYIQENDRLGKENSEILSKLKKAESLIERYEREKHAEAENRMSKAQLEELRENEKHLHNEISALEKRLKAEIETKRMLEDQLRQQEHEETHIQSSRKRIQEELHALKALSDSLSAENQGLRQDKLAITQRMEMLFERLENKETDVKQLIRLLEEFQRRYVQIVGRLRAELQRQVDGQAELDQIVKHAHQISSTLLQQGSRARTSTIKELDQIQPKSPKSSARSRQEEDDAISRQSSILGETSEKDTRPILSPIMSPIRSSSRASGSAGRQPPNRSLRTSSQIEGAISRTYSEDKPSTSLIRKYRRKFS